MSETASPRQDLVIAPNSGFVAQVAQAANLSDVKIDRHSVKDASQKTLLRERLGIGSPQMQANLSNPVADKIAGSINDMDLVATPEMIEQGASTLLMLDHPEIEKTKPTSSFDHIHKMKELGADVADVPLMLYRQSQMGTPRHFSWEQELKGYPNLYRDVDHLKETVNKLKTVVRHFASIVEPITEDTSHPLHLYALSEWPDLQAIGMIRMKSLGWFLDPLFAEDIKTTPGAAAFEYALDKVAAKYAEAIRKPVKTDNPEIPEMQLSTKDSILRLLDSDPSDTLVGLPTMASGEDTVPTRVAMLAISPDFEGLTGVQWLAEYKRSLVNILGIPSFLPLSVPIANRTSATRKAFANWEVSKTGFNSTFKVKGLGARVRNVFPVPFAINYALSPLYVQMSHARKNIKGLWHDPISWNSMVKQLTHNKEDVIMSADFSGMDLHMSPAVINQIARALDKHGFSKFATSMLAVIQDSMSVLTPSMTNSPRSVTKVTGIIPWLSGFKLTSEVDTIYGLAATLAALGQQLPTRDALQWWLDGKFIIYELGDDTIFALPKTIHSKVDWDKFSNDAMRLVGASIKRDDAPVFLKKIITKQGKSPRMLSRVIQQTFFNESRSDGDPPIVALVGLKARIEGLRDHVWFTEIYPKLEPIILDMVFAKELSLTRKDIQPDEPMTAQQMALLQEYADSLPGLDWIGKLIEQAKYSHSAAEALSLIPEKYRIQALNKDRKLYAEAIKRQPTQTEIDVLKSKVSQILA